MPTFASLPVKFALGHMGISRQRMSDFRVRVLCENSLNYANISRLARQRSVKPEPRAGEEETQKETTRPVSKFLLYGCQMSR